MVILEESQDIDNKGIETVSLKRERNGIPRIMSYCPLIGPIQRGTLTKQRLEWGLDKEIHVWNFKIGGV